MILPVAGGDGEVAGAAGVRRRGKGGMGPSTTPDAPARSPSP